MDSLFKEPNYYFTYEFRYIEELWKDDTSLILLFFCSRTTPDLSLVEVRTIILLIEHHWKDETNSSVLLFFLNLAQLHLHSLVFALGREESKSLSLSLIFFFIIGRKDDKEKQGNRVEE